MTHDNDKQEFQSILAALGERELTDWERERLWDLLAADESRLHEFTAHCFLGAEMESLTAVQLAGAGIARAPGNVVTLPGLRQREKRARFSRWSWRLASTGVAAALVAGLAWALMPKAEEESKVTTLAGPV